MAGVTHRNAAARGGGSPSVPPPGVHEKGKKPTASLNRTPRGERGTATNFDGVLTQKGGGGLDTLKGWRGVLFGGGLWQGPGRGLKLGGGREAAGTHGKRASRSRWRKGWIRKRVVGGANWNAVHSLGKWANAQKWERISWSGHEKGPAKRNAKIGEAHHH